MQEKHKKYESKMVGLMQLSADKSIRITFEKNRVVITANSQDGVTLLTYKGFEQWSVRQILEFAGIETIKRAED